MLPKRTKRNLHTEFVKYLKEKAKNHAERDREKINLRGLYLQRYITTK